jgi:hypothetical protein
MTGRWRLTLRGCYANHNDRVAFDVILTRVLLPEHIRFGYWFRYWSAAHLILGNADS